MALPNAPTGPAIDGLHSFKGGLVHSAAWDTSIDTKGKRVAVIGTGSSSIQMVPHLAEGIHSLFPVILINFK
jgi:cation diffusion facilitator CzcD-associated flavoprotein CzcO